MAVLMLMRQDGQNCKKEITDRTFITRFSKSAFYWQHAESGGINGAQASCSKIHKPRQLTPFTSALLPSPPRCLCLFTPRRAEKVRGPCTYVHNCHFTVISYSYLRRGSRAWKNNERQTKALLGAPRVALITADNGSPQILHDALCTRRAARWAPEERKTAETTSCCFHLQVRKSVDVLWIESKREALPLQVSDSTEHFRYVNALVCVILHLYICFLSDCVLIEDVKRQLHPRTPLSAVSGSSSFKKRKIRLLALSLTSV